MFGFLSFRTKIDMDARIAKSIQDHEDHETFVAQERQENSELRDALKENQSMERKQMEIIEKDQTEQKAKEQALASSVRFPEDEAFKRKMENARLYTILLLKRIEQKKKEKQTIAESVQTVIDWQRQDRESPPKDEKAALARFYVRTHY